MRSRVIQFVLLFAGCVAGQLFFFDNLELFGRIIAYPYVLFILLLPAGVPRGWTVTLGFVLGLAIDLFSTTLGVHAAATTLIAFLQPIFLETFQGGRSSGAEVIPSRGNMGWAWSLRFTLLLVLIHHAVLFFLSTTGWRQLPSVLLSLVGTVLLTSAVLLLAQVFIFSRPGKERS